MRNKLAKHDPSSVCLPAFSKSVGRAVSSLFTEQGWYFALLARRAHLLPGFEHFHGILLFS
jgi:hypothetical protein